jgi:hypothetical protein
MVLNLGGEWNQVRIPSNGEFIISGAKTSEYVTTVLVMFKQNNIAFRSES